MNINAKLEFEKVVLSLATSTKPLKERLRSETAPLQWIEESHVPDEHKAELRWIKEAISDPDLKGQPEEPLISRIVTLSHQLANSSSRGPLVGK